MNPINIQPRYYSHLESDLAKPSERDGAYHRLDWEVDPADVALILVDVWNWDYLEEVLERDEKIIRYSILPILTAFREKQLTIVHAPCSIVAEKYPHHRIPDFIEIEHSRPAWPPRDLVNASGKFAQYARPKIPFSEKVMAHTLNVRDIHPLVRPIDGEYVVGNNGDELDAVLRQKKSLFLFYVGFHSNLCLLGRDYGIPAMFQRGYQPMILTDAINAIETHETSDTREQAKQMEILYNLMGTYTLTTKELINDLKQDD